jgi:ABC-type multidrug transport system, ATPase component
MCNEIQTTGELGFVNESPGFLFNRYGLKELQILASLKSKIGEREFVRNVGQVELDSILEKCVGEYSFGMQQRPGCARMAIKDPSLLILNEPFYGLNKQEIEDMCELLKQLRNSGKSILLACRNGINIDELCDTVCEIDIGKLVLVRSMVME